MSVDVPAPGDYEQEKLLQHHLKDYIADRRGIIFTWFNSIRSLRYLGFKFESNQPRASFRASSWWRRDWASSQHCAEGQEGSTVSFQVVSISEQDALDIRHCYEWDGCFRSP